MLLVGVCTFLHDNCHQTQPQQQQEEKKNTLQEPPLPLSGISQPSGTSQQCRV